MATFANSLVRQRRFKLLLVTLVMLALFLGIVIVGVEQYARGAVITNIYDGLYWSVTTITSVGYGDMYPVTAAGKLIGMVLQLIGVVAFGLLIGLMMMSLQESRAKYYWARLFDRLDEMEKRLDKIEREAEFVVKQEVENSNHRDESGDGA